MTLMSHFRWQRACLWPTILLILCATGCSRPADVPSVGTTQPGQAPFQDHAAKSGHRDPAESSSAELNGPSAGTLPPFRDSQSLPAGTLLTVCLKGSVIAADNVNEIPFEAVVDESVVIDGNTLIPRGADVAGRIKSARTSTVKPNRGYVRMELESVHVGGLDVPVQTASLFARQSPQTDSGVRLEKGRRLTFRLTQSVSIGTQRAQLAH